MNTVNTKHDTRSYESTVNGKRGYQREIFDCNALYDGYIKAKKGSDWKPQVQKFEMNYLMELSQMQRDLKNMEYNFLPTTNFILKERGKTRYITGEQIQDRIVKHALCDEVLNPSVKRFLIYDNGASLKGKGISFSRKRLLTHLRKYYTQHNSNAGYILLFDFSKYYDNIRHDFLLEIFEKYVDNKHAMWILKKSIDRSKVDVSYMDEEEYDNCLNILFDSLKYRQIDEMLLTGEKYMAKHLNIGDQVAQTAGIVYPTKIDNYIKIVKGVRFYGRYMDDGYIIHEDKGHLKDLLNEIVDIAASIGIIVNPRKTHICKLSDRWRFLQVQYSLTDTGRIIQKINPKRLTAMRRKMKKVVWKMTDKDFSDWYGAWFRNHYKLMSKQQRKNMDELYNKLKGDKQSVQNQTIRRHDA